MTSQYDWSEMTKKNWKFYKPDNNLVYKITLYDELETFKSYRNSWTLIGESTDCPRENVALINLYNPEIVIPSIPFTNTQLIDYTEAHGQGIQIKEV